MIGEIYFPNVYLEKTLIDFGCILNNTEVQSVIDMTNVGPLLVNYKWKFVLESDSIVFNENRQFDADERKKVSKSNSNDSETKHSTTDENEATTKVEELDTKSNNRIEELLNRQKNEFDLPSIEEIFDISPLYGSLHPGEVQKVTVTYYGHREIRAKVKAICEIVNGPTYELMVRGEASVLCYEISDRIIDLGHIPFDEVCESAIAIRNLGKVNIKYNVVGLDSEVPTSNAVEPERPILIPSRGVIEAEKSTTILIRYLPAVPMAFAKKLLLQISHFAPEEIVIKGEAGFADLMLDLPRFENEYYKQLVKDAEKKIRIDLPQTIDSVSILFS